MNEIEVLDAELNGEKKGYRDKTQLSTKELKNLQGSKIEVNYTVYPHKVFTANELKKLVPNFREEAVTSDNPKIVDIVKVLFFRLGCVVKGNKLEDWIDIQEGITTRNRFKEVDNSTRYVLKERTDQAWLSSGCASSEARAFTQDFTLHMELVKMKCGEFSLKENSKDIEA